MIVRCSGLGGSEEIYCSFLWRAGKSEAGIQLLNQTDQSLVSRNYRQFNTRAGWKLAPLGVMQPLIEGGTAESAASEALFYGFEVWPVCGEGRVDRCRWDETNE